MMIGLCGAELVRPESVGASQGFLGWVAYLGAANAGIPLSIIVKDYGWGAYFSGEGWCVHTRRRSMQGVPCCLRTVDNGMHL